MGNQLPLYTNCGSPLCSGEPLDCACVHGGQGEALLLVVDQGGRLLRTGRRSHGKYTKCNVINNQYVTYSGLVKIGVFLTQPTWVFYRGFLIFF